MRLKATILVAALCIATQSGSLQQVNPKAFSEDKISLGSIELRLGMSREYVLSQLTKAGFSLKDWGNTLGVMGQVSGRDPSFVGNMSFKAGKLISVRKDWLPNGDDGLSVAEGIYGVFSNFHQEGRTHCELFTGANQSPNGDNKEVALFCKPGQKYISIQVVHNTAINGVTVTEILADRESRQ